MEEEKQCEMGGERVLIDRKGSSGPCARLARCRGCGVLIQTCCHVFYFFKQ